MNNMKYFIVLNKGDRELKERLFAGRKILRQRIKYLLKNIESFKDCNTDSRSSLWNQPRFYELLIKYGFDAVVCNDKFINGAYKMADALAIKIQKIESELSTIQRG